MLKSYIINQIKKNGYEVTKPGVTDKTSVYYRKILSHFSIDYLIDVGANEGQFAEGMRQLGYQGTLRSFEPISQVFKILNEKARMDKDWLTENMALGNEDTEQEINIAKNTVSSSLLEMDTNHLKAVPDSVFVAREMIKVKRLDTIMQDGELDSKNIFLKLDVQGYEKFVLEGAANSLEKIKLVQLEMALIPLYKGEALLADMVMYMDKLGFKLYNLFSGFGNFDTGQMYQVDGVFVREDLIG